MKYNSGLPDDSVNVSKENFFFQMLKLLVALLIFSFLVYGALKVALHLAVDNLPPSYEKKLTQFVSMNMVDVGSPTSNSYLDEIVADIAKCAKLPYDVKVFMIPDDTPNAFALPGGTIYITKGMLKSLKNQNELASIIGHEMGHFKHRHHLKSLGTSLLYSLLTLTLGEGYGTILNTTLDISNVKYSQSAELEADAFALDVMQCTYGNVSDSTTLFSRMEVGSGSEWSYFFATHPAFNKRLEKMQERIEDKGYNTEVAVIPLREKF
jgi:Zn-dependent protease with chaperone function